MLGSSNKEFLSHHSRDLAARGSSIMLQFLGLLIVSPDPCVADDTNGHPSREASQTTSQSRCKMSVAVEEVVWLCLGVDC